LNEEVANASDVAMQSDTAFIDQKNCSTEMHIQSENTPVPLNIEHGVVLESSNERVSPSTQGTSKVMSNVSSTKLNSLKDETILEKIDEKSSINLNGPINHSKSEFLI